MKREYYISSEYFQNSYTLRLTPSALAIKIFFGILQHGVLKLQEFDEKIN